MASSLRRLREYMDSADVAEIAKRRRIQRRASQKRALAAFREQYGKLPRYPVGVLQFCLRWLEARRHRTWETEVREITFYLRRAAVAEFGTGEPIANRGVAGICRELGCGMRRGNKGMVAIGIKLT